MAPQNSKVASLTREQSLQAMKDANVTLPDCGVGRGEVLRVLAELGQLEPPHKRLVLAEFATRLWIKYLAPVHPLSPGFEEELWVQFSGDQKLEVVVPKLALYDEIAADSKKRYYEYVKGLLKKSGKTREEFYGEVLAESGVDLCAVDFGEKALAFQMRAAESVHQEHLLVWYSVELLKRAHEELFGREAPMSDEVLASCYELFEEKIPLKGEEFERATANHGSIKAMVRELSPHKAPLPEVFREVAFQNRRNVLGYILTSLCHRMWVYEKAVRENAASATPRLDGPYPYMFICQSTGWGKSRLADSLESEGSSIVFNICLRRRGEEGEPRRTPTMAKAVEDCRSRDDFICILFGCLSARKAHQSKTSAQGVSSVPPSDEALEGFWEEAARIAANAKKAVEGITGIIGQCRSLARELANGRKIKRIIFAWDEAAGLCKAADGEEPQLQFLLEAMAIFPKRVFAMFMDTNSSMDAFVSTKLAKFDTNLEEDEAYWGLLIPYVFLPNMDTIELPERAEKLLFTIEPLERSPSHGGSEFNPLRMARPSRPRFGTYVLGAVGASEVVDLEAIFGDLCAFAHQKANFLCRPIRQGESREIVHLAAEAEMVVLSARINILSLTRATSISCVAEGLATLLATSLPGRRVAYARYISEPMVGVAAFMELGAPRRWEGALKALLSMLESGGAGAIFRTGDAGEFVAAVLMTLAYDHIVRRLMGDSPRLVFIGCPIPVGSFLQAILGNEAFEKVRATGCNLILNSFICVLQMIVAKDAITRPTMLKAFERRSALICPRGAYAADFVLPVALSHPTDRNMDLLVDNDITGIFVQVKNWQRSSLPSSQIEEAFAKLDDFAKGLVADAPYVSMFVSVAERSVSEESRALCRYEEGRLQLVHSGLSHHRSPCLSRDVAPLLRQIAERGCEFDESRRQNYKTERGQPRRRIDKLSGAMQPLTYVDDED